MKILLLNQTFYPDVVATSQYLSQLALALAEQGHQVTVVAGRRGYDAQHRLFLKRETWRGIQIHRVSSIGLGKGAKWKRAVDFGSFMLNCAALILTLPRHDTIVTLTSPPLISFLGALLAWLRRCRLCYWVMDLNPDEAVAAGWLREGSLTARVLEALSRFSMRQSSRIIVLDRFARQRVCAKGIGAEKVSVIPPWSHEDAVWFDPEGRKRFQNEHGLAGKWVVMYSGNHSPCHPLDTLLEAARILAKERPEIVFCFVGGGSGFADVQRFAAEHGLESVRWLPYQPAEKLPALLSAADLHVVVMGEPFVGIIHPCKIYNILAVAGAPAHRPGILYIGPEVSHVSELLEEMADAGDWGWARHGDVEGVVRVIESQLASVKEASGTAGERSAGQATACHARFSKRVLLPALVRLIEEG